MHIGIAGAGLMGRLLAWKLSTLGHAIDLFDQDLSGQQSAAYAAAGMLSPCTEAIVSQASIFELGRQSLALWPRIIKDLGATIPLNTNGSIIVCHSNDTAELHHFIQRLSLKHDATQIQSLDHDQLTQLEPELCMNHGFHLINEGTIDNRCLLSALNSALSQRAVTQIEAHVTSTQPYCIQTTTQAYHYDWAFDCRGMGNKQHFKTLRAVRGEVIRVHAPDVNLTHMIRLLHPRYPVYIVPQANQQYVIGATEIESDDTSPISVRSCLELLNAAYSIHSGFAEARIIETCSALRPTLPDNLPRIIHEAGFSAINGLYRHGFLIAPALLEQCLLTIPEKIT